VFGTPGEPTANEHNQRTIHVRIEGCVDDLDPNWLIDVKCSAGARRKV
jgi:hypothetical protein